MSSRLVRRKDLVASDFPITVKVPGQIVTLGNLSMLESHRIFLDQIGCTDETEVGASGEPADAKKAGDE